MSWAIGLADDRVVLDASALVDLLLGGELGASVTDRLTGMALHAPCHLEAEVLSALGRLHRGGVLTAEVAERSLLQADRAPIEHHALGPLLAGAWRRREQLRLVDGLYVELAAQLGAPLVTTDARLGRAVPGVDVVTS